jgi:predicted Holliday junction resolvase-like endonuclease
VYNGKLSDGAKIQDLTWASNSSVACFPATKNQKFSGNHVLYTTTIPKRSEMFIKVVPKNKNQNFSLYAYEVGVTNKQLPPNLNSCVTCEADYKWDRKWKGKTQDHTREVRLNAINNPYKVVIGVVGANGLATGEFTLEIRLNGGEEMLKSTSKVRVTNIQTSGAITTIPGNLNAGSQIQDLTWAANSSVTCFPATQNQKFTGNHVLYATTIPKYSEMFIKVIPKNKQQNFSLYAYMVGVTNEELPPNLNRCITCEADYKWDRKWKGKTQDHTRKVRLNAINRSYKVVIGVVGAEGLAEGDFELEIEIKSR